jgi:hypothetical protein
VIAYLQADLPALLIRLNHEMDDERWLAAYEQARAIIAHYERRAQPTNADHESYLAALDAELKALSYLPHRKLRDTAWIIKRARAAHHKLRRSASAGSPLLASGYRSFVWACLPLPR